MKNTIQKVEITHRTVVFTVFFLLSLYLIFLLKDILLLLFIAILFMTAINPLVTKLHQRGIPRTMSIALVYVLVLVSISTAVALIVPPLVSQLNFLISQISLPPNLMQDIVSLNVSLQDLQVITDQLNSLPRILDVVFSTFSFVIVFFTVAVLAFYLLLERQHIHKHFRWLFGDNDAEKKAEIFVEEFETQIGGWVRGEFTLMLAVGLLTFVGLRLLSIPYSLPLAILAGILEILPNVGPTVAAIPAIVIAYITISPAMAIAVLALNIFIQQLENNFIVPIVMRKTVGLNPIATILLLLVGFKLNGLAGAILAIPLFLMVKVIILQWYMVKSHKKESVAETISHLKL